MGGIFQKNGGAHGHALVDLFLTIDLLGQVHPFDLITAAHFGLVVDGLLLALLHVGGFSAEEICLSLIPGDELYPRCLFQRLGLGDLVRRHIAVKVSEAHDVHQAQAAGQTGFFQTLELKSAINLHIDRFHRAGLGIGLDGQKLAGFQPVKLDQRGQLVVENFIAGLEIGVIRVKESREQF